MKIIGIDLDGTITPHGFYNPNIRLPWWLFYLLVPVILVSRPRKAVVKKMQLMQDQGYKFIIVTSRPNQFFQFTKRQLMSYHVPFYKLFCVGGGKGANERKLKVINGEKIEIFVDRDNRLVGFLKRNSVNAVTNLDDIS